MTMGDLQEMTAGAAVFARLARLGVEVVFANSGTDFPPVIEGLAEADASGVALPRTALVAHEHVAMGMAHGYYLATGRPQAVMLHTNVGLANGAIGAINAAIDRVPVLVMSGRTPTVEAGRFGARTVPIGWGQEMRDQTALVREACKWDYELRFPEQVPAVLDRAHAIARSTPAGPVYLSLPREVLCQPCPPEPLAADPAAAPAIRRAPPAELAEVAALLARAERPVIIAQRGAGSAEGFDALARLTERWALPVCQYWAVALAIGAEHPCSVGADPGPWLADADVVVVIDGLAPWSPDVHRLARDVTVVQLGPDPLEARIPIRHFPAHRSVVTEVGPALAELERALDVLAPDDDLDAARSRRRARLERFVRPARPSDDQLTKSFVGHCVGDAVRGERVTVLSELGCPLDSLGLADHDSWRQEPHAGGLGWALPCAMGIKLADPERTVVATMGDGSYLFANPVACHQVAEAHGIGVLSVVLNNAGYGAVRRSVLDLYPTGYAAKEDEMMLTGLSPSPDLAMVARASRAYAETVTDPSALPDALARALAVTRTGRQALLDVRVVE